MDIKPPYLKLLAAILMASIAWSLAIAGLSALTPTITGPLAVLATIIALFVAFLFFQRWVIQAMTGWRASLGIIFAAVLLGGLGSFLAGLATSIDALTTATGVAVEAAIILYVARSEWPGATSSTDDVAASATSADETR